MDFVEKRIEKRVDVQLRADACEVDASLLEGIMEGNGYADLFQPDFGLRRPREGMSRVVACDISRSGLRLKGAFSFSQGMKIAVDLHLPQDRLLVKVLLEVMWCEEVEKGFFFAGARFAALEEQSSRRVEEFVMSEA